jgi:hypothetical protein
MIRKFILLVLIILISASFAGCSLFNGSNGENEKGKNIYAHPKVLNLNRGKLASLPEYNEYSIDTFQVDLRSYDLISLDLKDRFNDLTHADFDNRTKWPYILPKGFDPKKIFEYGKSPGMGIRKLHKEAIDGKEVGVAMIGGPILADHTEYKEQLKVYKELNFTSKVASPEGTAGASVIAGKSTGVSPGVYLYYIALNPAMSGKSDSNDKNNGYNGNNLQISNAVDWIVNFNKNLPKDKKIRVLCIQNEITTDDEDYLKIMASIKKAAEMGIFVVSTISHRLYSHEVYFKGLSRVPLYDPDVLLSYLPGKSWTNSFYTLGRYLPSSYTMFVPSESRCTASPTGKNDYAFYSVNDWNLFLPYIAGLYALACQEKPGITPEEFIDKSVKTSDILEIMNININYKYKLKNIVNPTKLIQSLGN